MSDEIRISLFEVVGSPLCVSSCDGNKVYSRVDAALRADKRISISFQNVTVLTAAFLNAAIGQLYGVFKEVKIRSLLKVEDIEQDDLALIKRVVDNAKLYYKDPKKYDRAVQKALIG